MIEFVAATNNLHKLEEFSRILNPLGFEVCSLSSAGAKSDPEEDGDSFEQNALIKARAAAIQLSGRYVLADDSGLCTLALCGEPGIFSARYAGENSTAQMCINKLLSELADLPAQERKAYFVCVCAVITPTGKHHLFRGECNGTIATNCSGTGGFGYDPIFLVDGKSFAEFTDKEKDAVSHRGKALKQVAEFFKYEY